MTVVRRNSKKKWLILAGILLVIVAAVVVFLIYSNREVTLTDWSQGNVTLQYPESISEIHVLDGENLRLEIVPSSGSDTVPRIDVQQVDASTLDGAAGEESFSLLATALLQQYFEGGVDESLFSVEQVLQENGNTRAVVQVGATESSPAMQAQVTLVGTGSSRLLGILLLPDDASQGDSWIACLQSLSLQEGTN